MSDIVLDVQSASVTPAAGQVVTFPETTGKRLTYKDDAGRTYTLGVGGIRNYAVASVTGYAADTYLVGSPITVPASLTLQVGSQYRCKISMQKTAAGVAAPTIIVRIGTLGTTGDAAIVTFTGAAQTAAADIGFVEILLTIRTIGAAATSQIAVTMQRNVAGAAGLSGVTVGGTNVNTAAGATFNSTTASLIIGVSLNYGASVALTTDTVEAELLNI